MAYEIKLIKDKRIIEIENKNEITNEDMITQTKEVIILQHEKHIFSILADFASVRVNTNISDVFQFPELYEQMGMDHKSKIAVFVSDIEIKTEELQFYETICLNRGWNIKIFLDRKDAIKWLLDSQR
jgi:hypothetical protein